MTESTDDVTLADAPSSPAVAMPSDGNRSSDSLALVTQYTVDAEGRTTEEISPNLNVTYTVYNDSNHSTIVYPGWHEIPRTSNYTTTGPVQVELDDWADGYTDNFTYAYTPSTANAPGGSFAIGSL